MALKLYTSTGNKNGFKALIAAEFAGVHIDVLPFQWGETNKSPDFLRLTPIGKIPVLQTPHGSVFESNAIARYVARLSDKGLFGTTLLDMAHVEQWIDFSSNELDIPLSRWGNPLHGYGPRIPQVEEAAIVASKRGLKALDDHLAHHTYLVGHHVTLADIVAVCSLYNAIRGLLSPDFMHAYPHVQRYFFTLVHQPRFAKVLGAVEQIKETPADVLEQPLMGPRAAPPPGAADTPALVTKTTTVDTVTTTIVPTDGAAGGDAKKAAKDAKKEAKKEKKEEKKEAKEEKKEAKEAKKQEKAAPAAADDEEDEPAPKPKAKSALDLLPPSSMNMDAWKRLYSNTKAKEFKEVALKGFWEMYDPEGYSLWFCDYKFNDENQVTFVTMNKVSGFLQRMDHVRKHAFAKIGILGADVPYQIKGVWLFRGLGIPAEVTEECYDAELYEWTKVDVSDEAQKQLVNDYFEEPDEISGLKVLEVKCFK